MYVLGIETSCDETGAAIVDENGLVYSDIVASQIKEHAPYGGVVPELASRAHMRAVLGVVDKALEVLPNRFADLSAIAVTQGPGLVGALLIGLQTAKAIAWSRNIPIVGVNHLLGHLFSAYLQRKGKEITIPDFPFVGLIASGGHTALYDVRSESEVSLIGQTRDDAAGEAFDKAAKLLGLGYPGGPVIDRLAAQGDPKAIAFPRPMVSGQNLEFSFAGLKTALVQHVQRQGVPCTESDMNNLCASYQQALVDVLVRKSLTACEMMNAKHLVITGGVAANRMLRTQAQAAGERVGIQVHIPPIASCTDNAAMIAYVGARQFLRGELSDHSMDIFSRDPMRKRGKFPHAHL